MSLEPITRQEKIIAGQDLTPITRLEKFLKNFGGSGGGGGAQPDLSQTDPTQPDYVKGVIRQESLPEGYPYKEQSEVEVLAETSLSLTEQNGMFFCTPQIPLYIEVGKQYKVIWGGSEYLVEGKEDGDENQTMQYIGNVAIPGGGGEDTGEPFLITSMYGSPQFFGTSAGEHTVSIFGYAETIHQMAPEFLPALTSPNGTKYQLTVADDGTLSAVEVS